MSKPLNPIHYEQTKMERFKSSFCLPLFRHSHHRKALCLAGAPVSPLVSGMAQEESLNSRPRSPEILKDKCGYIIHRIGHRRRHYPSVDFHYDASSYALNFDEGRDDSRWNEFPLKDFSARLPPSPPPRF